MTGRCSIQTTMLKGTKVRPRVSCSVVTISEELVPSPKNSSTFSRFFAHYDAKHKWAGTANFARQFHMLTCVTSPARTRFY
jgi:hypothetical protein